MKTKKKEFELKKYAKPIRDGYGAVVNRFAVTRPAGIPTLVRYTRQSQHMMDWLAWPKRGMIESDFGISFSFSIILLCSFWRGG